VAIDAVVAVDVIDAHGAAVLAAELGPLVQAPV
jgi:hypothetical protein